MPGQREKREEKRGALSVLCAAGEGRGPGATGRVVTILRHDPFSPSSKVLPGLPLRAAMQILHLHLRAPLKGTVSTEYPGSHTTSSNTLYILPILQSIIFIDYFLRMSFDLEPTPQRL